MKTLLIIFLSVFFFTSQLSTQIVPTWKNLHEMGVSNDSAFPAGANPPNGFSWYRNISVATSKNLLENGKEGWFEVSLAETSQAKKFGFTIIDHFMGERDSEFMVYASANGVIGCYEKMYDENYVYHANVGTYGIEDKLRLTRQKDGYFVLSKQTKGSNDYVELLRSTYKQNQAMRCFLQFGQAKTTKFTAMQCSFGEDTQTKLPRRHGLNEAKPLEWEAHNIIKPGKEALGGIRSIATTDGLTIPIHSTTKIAKGEDFKLEFMSYQPEVLSERTSQGIGLIKGASIKVGIYKDLDYLLVHDVYSNVSLYEKDTISEKNKKIKDLGKYGYYHPKIRWGIERKGDVISYYFIDHQKYQKVHTSTEKYDGALTVAAYTYSAGAKFDEVYKINKRQVPQLRQYDAFYQIRPLIKMGLELNNEGDLECKGGKDLKFVGEQDLEENEVIIQFRISNLNNFQLGLACIDQTDKINAGLDFNKTGKVTLIKELIDKTYYSNLNSLTYKKGDKVKLVKKGNELELFAKTVGSRSYVKISKIHLRDCSYKFVVKVNSCGSDEVIINRLLINQKTEDQNEDEGVSIPNQNVQFLSCNHGLIRTLVANNYNNYFEEFNANALGYDEINAYLLSQISLSLYPRCLIDNPVVNPEHDECENDLLRRLNSDPDEFECTFRRKRTDWFDENTQFEFIVDEELDDRITIPEIEVNGQSTPSVTIDLFDPEAMCIANDDYIIISFRGTDRVGANDCVSDPLLHEWGEWITTDFYCPPVPSMPPDDERDIYSYFNTVLRGIDRIIDLPGFGETFDENLVFGSGAIHAGFLFATMRIEQQIYQFLDHHRTNNQPIWITGHSLGAANAQVLAYLMAQNYGVSPQGVYGYAPPRIGTESFINNTLYPLLDSNPINARKRIQRFEYNMDPIPYAPFTPIMNCIPAGQRNYYHYDNGEVQRGNNLKPNNHRTFLYNIPFLIEAEISNFEPFINDIESLSLDDLDVNDFTASFCYHNPEPYVIAAYNNIANRNRYNLPPPPVAYRAQCSTYYNCPPIQSMEDYPGCNQFTAELVNGNVGFEEALDLYAMQLMQNYSEDEVDAREIPVRFTKDILKVVITSYVPDGIGEYLVPDYVVEHNYHLTDIFSWMQNRSYNWYEIAEAYATYNGEIGIREVRTFVGAYFQSDDDFDIQNIQEIFDICRNTFNITSEKFLEVMYYLYGSRDDFAEILMGIFTVFEDTLNWAAEEALEEFLLVVENSDLSVLGVLKYLFLELALEPCDLYYTLVADVEISLESAKSIVLSLFEMDPIEKGFFITCIIGRLGESFRDRILAIF